MKKPQILNKHTILLAGILLQLNLLAQPVWHFWGDFDPSYKLSENTKLFGDVGFQVFDLQIPAYRFNIRPGVKWQANKVLSATAGLGYFYIFADERADIHEIRPFLGLMLKWPNGTYFQPAHYFRYEARNVWKSNAYTNFYASRLRYELKQNIKWSWYGNTQSKWYNPIAVEVFLNFPVASSAFLDFERLRISAGFGYKFSEKQKLELYYLYQGKEALPDEFLIHTTDHMLRLRYYIDFGK